MLKKISRKTLSLILTISLALMASFAIAISVFFQRPSYDGQETISDLYLFASSDFEALQRLTLTNPLGIFSIENQNENNSTSPSWLVTSPGQLYADERTLNNIFSALTQAKIKRVFQKDLINLTNFSLENPLVKIDLEESNGTVRTVSFGLINPLDQSTYAMISDQDNIYQIERPSLPLSNLGLSDFAESRLAPFLTEEIVSIQIYRSDNTQRPPSLSLTLSDTSDSFVSSNSNQLSNQKVFDYLKDFTELRMLFILDKQDEKLEKFITNTLSRPLYTMLVTLRGNKVIRYTVVLINTPVPSIKTDRKQLVLIVADNRHHPFLFAREALNIFSKVDRDLL